MTKFARNLTLIIATLVVLPFGLKLLWDDYQMRRAMEQTPKVLALIDQIRPFSGSTRIDNGDAYTTSEYASSVWRHYLADAKCTDVQEHLDAEARRVGFTFNSVQPHNAGKQVFHRNGQYEIRTFWDAQNGDDCAYAVSVNWYGLSR